MDSTGTRKPEWIKVKAPGGAVYVETRNRIRSNGLHTVCEEARCPNIGECWGAGTATIMILGDTCSRGCRFCAVKTGNPHGVLDRDEPARVAKAVIESGLRYVVLTSVNRDDLEDEGSSIYAETIVRIKGADANILVEALIPDYLGDNLKKVCEAAPDVLGHNIETVRRLTPAVRDRRAGYEKSLSVLREARSLGAARTKSSIMLGLGETPEEVLEAMSDLRKAGVEILTLGQYLRPSERHLPVREFIAPERFDAYKKAAIEMGFLFVASAPLVRSSYKAADAVSISR